MRLASAATSDKPPRMRFTLPTKLLVRPKRYPAPVCGDFGDAEAVLRYEREVRVQRAHAAAYRVELLDACVDGRYRVVGEASTYVVDIVDASGRRDGCTCPDFATNRIGTCKHLEAVRRAIREKSALARAFGRLGEHPRCPTLYLRGSGDAAAVHIAPLPTGRGRSGRWSESVLDPRAAAQLLSDAPRTLRITAALPASVRRLERRSELTERAFRVGGAIERGELSVDVLRTRLFPYQREGVAHLVSRGRALLADDMGLGKTVQTLAACELLRARGEARRIVIVTNASLKAQWAREIAKHTTARAAVLAGPSRVRQEVIGSDAPYLVLNYELATRDRELLRELSIDVLVLDEAQRAKNFRTRTADTLRSLDSRFLFVLTGTPIENRLDDLYSLVQLVDPVVFGPLHRFNTEYARQDARGKIVGYHNLGALRERVAPVLLRRTKEAVLAELPSLTAQTRYVPLSPMQRDLEHHHRTSAGMILARAQRRPLTPKEQLALSAHLAQARMACDAAILVDEAAKNDPVPKLAELEAVLAEVAEQGSSKVIVFSEWTRMLELACGVAKKLGMSAALLHGGIPSSKRPALIERFVDDPGIRILFSTDAGGAGLNLQVASYVVHLDLPWNPARLDQRNGRAHRIGQTRGVTCIHLCAERGIERGIEGTLQAKRRLRAGAVDPSSELETLDMRTFTQVAKELTEVLDVVEEGEESVVELADSVPVTELPDAAMRVAENQPSRPKDAPVERLRLAELVLAAGFSHDALRASYEALAGALRGRLADPSVARDHLALVGAARRELLASGEASMATLAALAYLRDLCELAGAGEALGIEVAEAAIAEARVHVERLEASRPSAAVSAGG